MAIPRSTMGADARSIHPTLAKAAIAAAAAQAEVRAAAEYLAEAMQRIHGGEWNIDIEHEHRFVMIAQRRERARIVPKREIA